MKKEDKEEENLEDLEEAGLLSEFWGFLMESKKFWMIPILLILFLLGLLILFSSSSAAPFIYTLF